MSATETKNGVNVEALLGAREALGQTPEAGAFKWRATCNWVNGTHSHSEVEGFFFNPGRNRKHCQHRCHPEDHSQHRQRAPELVATQTAGSVRL